MVAENDPYNDVLDSEKKDIRPGFLGGNGEGKAAGVLKAAENVAGTVAAVKGGGAAVKGAGAAKEASAAKANASESNPKGFYNRNTENNDDDAPKSSGAKTALVAAAPILILLLAVGAIAALVVALPVMMIGALDYNLMKVLGFEATIGIIEEQGAHITAEFAKSGEMPKDYFKDLVANGIDVGQITANGDFVRTDIYIANIEERDDLIASASGFNYISEDEGELAMLWDGKLIQADDFVAAVESDPKLYAAYSSAADLSTKYYYGKDVEEVYKNMGLSRGNFNDWETTGNYVEDDKKFVEILNATLDDGSDVVVGGAYDNKPHPEGAAIGDDSNSGGGTYIEQVSGNEGAASGGVSEETREYIYRWDWQKDPKTGLIFYLPVYSDNSTERATELLSAALSSSEPYLASNAFITVEEAIQRARVQGRGPVNHVMNTLTKGTTVSYQNVETGGVETSNFSILETKNFRAAVSDSDYDKNEAQNFGRDRIMKTTGETGEIKGKDIIRKTTIGTGGKQDSNSVVRNGKSDTHADEGTVSKANSNLELSSANTNSKTFQSVIGGNRIIEGGSFLSNTINMYSIGAMPSNAGTIAEYHKEEEKVLARRAEAERATKNPFDITSPYTFLGSIVHSFATSMLGTYSSATNGFSAVSSIGATANKAVANLTGTATAAGGNNEYTTMSGLGCETLDTAGGIEGDLYCSSHNTVNTEHMNYTKSDWDAAIDQEGYKEFTLLGMDRYASVGIKNAEVCERYHDLYDGIGEKILNFFKDMVGAYETCKIEVDDNDNITDPEELEKLKAYTGAKYSFGSEGSDENKLYSGYALYSEVRSLLSGEENTTAKIRDEFYKEHPKDNSAAGIIARRSGLSKEEATIALNYASYLDMIANYDPSNRMTSSDPVISFEKPILNYHSDEVALTLYAWYSKQAEYDDLRTRNFVV